ncbi:MAG: type II toxin-antitoxin system Phd/YefM family antitoxin [Clostridiales bacterium]|nr:type II toxin-antitoxin system Phd/YefM family antitoxin [Clostridiales bacterium]
MYITSSANLRNNYRKIANRCKETGEPVFLTTNGEGDLVLMSLEAYTELITHNKIEKELMRIEAEKKEGTRGYVTLEEWAKEAEEIIRVAEKEAKGYGDD